MVFREQLDAYTCAVDSTGYKKTASKVEKVICELYVYSPGDNKVFSVNSLTQLVVELEHIATIQLY